MIDLSYAASRSAAAGPGDRITHVQASRQQRLLPGRARLKVILLADACASQAIGTLSAEQAHAAAVQRMAYLFAAVEDTDVFVARVRVLQPAAG